MTRHADATRLNFLQGANRKERYFRVLVHWTLLNCGLRFGELVGLHRSFVEKASFAKGNPETSGILGKGMIG